MSLLYIAPVITDRSPADIAAQTTKAFFNVLDWQRIYNNAEVTKQIVDFLLGLNITFNTVGSVSITTIPTVAELNTLLANINRIYQASGLQTTLGLELIKEDWQDGTTVQSPNYINANEWENLVNKIFTSITPVFDYRIYCGVAGAGQLRFYQHRWRVYPWVAESANPVRRLRTGRGVMGRSLTFQNKFRRYD